MSVSFHNGSEIPVFSLRHSVETLMSNKVQFLNSNLNSRSDSKKIKIALGSFENFIKSSIK
jgi:hypothetical protein